jgi:hypothetical protein
MGNWIGHILHSNCLLKHVIEGKIDGIIEVKEDEGEDVSNYWMTLRQRFLNYVLRDVNRRSINTD